MDPEPLPAALSAPEKPLASAPLRVQLVAPDEALEETKVLKRWDDMGDALTRLTRSENIAYL